MAGRVIGVWAKDGMTMRRQLVRTGNRVTIELEESELEKLGIDEKAEVDVAIDGGVMVVMPVEGEGTTLSNARPRRSTADTEACSAV